MIRWTNYNESTLGGEPCMLWPAESLVECYDAIDLLFVFSPCRQKNIGIFYDFYPFWTSLYLSCSHYWAVFEHSQLSGMPLHHQRKSKNTSLSLRMSFRNLHRIRKGYYLLLIKWCSYSKIKYESCFALVTVDGAGHMVSERDSWKKLDSW